MKDPRIGMFESFAGLESNFKSTLMKGQELASDFDGLSERFFSDLRQVMKNVADQFGRENSLSGLLGELAANVDAKGVAWQKNIEARDKGVRFRKSLEDSLLVFVAGKVKSGKSSLGNYIAWGSSQPSDSLKSSAEGEFKPRFVSHANTNVEHGEKGEYAQEKREFRVGATEATSSIQSFSLPGFTWIDSPGLHSVTGENGRLTKEYLEHADLVLFAMNSSAPGRTSDFEEIRPLLESGKRVLFLITSSDNFELDEDENGNIVHVLSMKDKEVRRGQVDDVRKRLAEFCGNELSSLIESVEIIPISVRFAEKNFGNSEKFEESGMAEFFFILKDVCLSEGIRRKREVPMRNLQRFINGCRQDLKGLIHDVEDFSEALEKEGESLRMEMDKSKRDARMAIRQLVDRSFDEIPAGNFSGREGEIKRKIQEISRNVTQAADSMILESVNNLLSSFAERFRVSSVDIIGSSLMERIPEFKVEKVNYNNYSAEPGTRGRNAAIGAAAGGILGAALGPWGIAAGSLLGGALGSATGSSEKLKPVPVEYELGSNLNEIRGQLSRSIEDFVAEKIESNVQAAWGSLKSDMDVFVCEMRGVFHEFDSGLDGLIHEIELELN